MKDGKSRINFPKKHKSTVLSILVLSIIIGYIARMGISVALPFISEDFVWTSVQQGNLGGLLLGIFLVGYGLSNLFLSPFIDTYGAKKTLVLSIIFWSLSIVFGARFGNIYWLFLVSRLLLGLAQGVLFPTASKVVTGWFSPEERARANSLWMSGAPIGLMLSPLLLTPIIVKTSWQMSFYFIALLGCVLILPVVFLISDAPENSNERKNKAIENRDVFNYKIIVKEILRNKQFQIILISFTAMLCVWWGISLWLPTYLVEAQGFSVSKMSYGASFPYIGAILGLYLGAWISDITGDRKKIIVIALISTTLMLLALVILHIQSYAISLVFLSLIFFFGNMSPGIFFAILQSRVSKQIVGSATGIMNGIGNGLGFLGPVIVGSLAALTGSYNTGLVFLGGIALVGGLVFQFCYKPLDSSDNSKNVIDPLCDGIRGNKIN